MAAVTVRAATRAIAPSRRRRYRQNAPEPLREGEHDLPVRHGREERGVQPLGPDREALGVAARAEVPALAREREQVLRRARWQTSYWHEQRDASVSIFDVASGKELARVPTTRRAVHGVVVSDDDRYAFISVEGVGAQPGTVDVIALVAMQKVASVDVGQRAGGIDFPRSETPTKSPAP